MYRITHDTFFIDKDTPTEKDMDNDEKLRDLKELVKDLGGGYRGVINTHKAMIRYLIFVMENRGAI